MKLSISPQFSDSRGTITDLLVGESIDAITQITFSVGAVRANHFHKFTTQWTYVVSGDVRYVSRTSDGVRSDEVLPPGSMVVSKPNEAHAFQAMTEAVIFVFTKGPRAGFDYEKDTFRLETPLIEIVK
ncbi:cupin domain-containing protein [Devosia neptuniae]|uniref:cupin domain-containing protein n=1 Tax=Devosia neptuniae TaxID=191302 RepID=UPI0022AEF400|nr:cupin domain-containing protein [Devosia neptuniae]MCZ4346749.1 hypothetical protein [Devosia neptuniae]|tara:strand:- start:30515 stop:30898 length:384 start_codon:yes stop_codon:yes gene_type:complete